MAIDEKLIALNTAKQSIKTALVNKGVDVSNIPFTDYGSVVANLPSPKEEATSTLTPDFSSGNQVIVPLPGMVLKEVTLIKPADLIPENIKKDKNVCGVVGTSFTAIELTQTQYDALSTKDSNTYYLIVEE